MDTNGNKSQDMGAIQAVLAQAEAKIRPNQRKAIEALLAGATIEKAAIAAGVQERTIYVWRTQPHFKLALQAATNEVLDSAVIALSGATIEAVHRGRCFKSTPKSPKIPQNTPPRLIP